VALAGERSCELYQVGTFFVSAGISGRIVAADVHDRRLARLGERMRRAGAHNIERRLLASERDRWVRRQRGKFDRVLVDAPCTGTGSWRRNPDARWTRNSPGLAELTALQDRILDSAARLVKPGGRLVYATCSLLADENEARILRFLEAAPDFARAAEDRRFVQVLLPVMGETPPGRRVNWPIYAAAERLGLPVALHAGSAYRHPPTPVGWPSYLAEDYAAQAAAFQSALTSLIAEGVFQKFPGLTVVFAESGVSWLPAHLWRLTKYWRGLRMEIPWVDRSPEEIVRERVRFTLQPFDAPPEAVARLLDHLGSGDMLLFSTDYPHWQFDGMGVLPEGLPEALVRRIAVDNPRATYPRLREGEP